MWIHHVLLVTFVGLATIALQSVKSLQEPDTANDTVNRSLCGESVNKSIGMIGGLYYVLYESNGQASVSDAIPIILWLSGGPGCSGLVGSLFEFGPCVFDDEDDALRYNPHAWTTLAHVIYVDQPMGTGFSGSLVGSTWTEQNAMRDLRNFLDTFIQQDQRFQDSDLYIFGESFGGHYVPDLAASLLRTEYNRWRPMLKGIGIGNGVVSPRAFMNSLVNFALTNNYDQEILGDTESTMRVYAQKFRNASGNCTEHHDIKSCNDAVSLYRYASELLNSLVVGRGHNLYDMRRPCHVDDDLGLCYRFSHLESFVNQDAVLAYFDAHDRHWSVCNFNLSREMRELDDISESEDGVRYLLNQNVRVLVYAGDADSVANWMSQDEWTRQMSWKHQQVFSDSPLVEFHMDGKPIGQLRSSHGLSFVRIYEAGHVSLHGVSSTLCLLLTMSCVRWFLETSQWWRWNWCESSCMETLQRGF